MENIWSAVEQQTDFTYWNLRINCWQ